MAQPVKSSCVKKNALFHPNPAILCGLYGGSENPGKLRNIGEKQEGSSQ
jgi:hypothetical protein